MAQKDLQQFLIKLDKELMHGKATRTAGLEEYRKKEGNRKASTLTYSPTHITHALKVLGGDVPKNLQTQYAALVTRLNHDIQSDFMDLKRAYPQEVTVLTSGPVVSAIIVKSGKRDNYKTLKDTYNATLDAFYVSFLILIEKPGGLVRENAKGKERQYTPGPKGGKGGLKFRAQTHEGGGSNVLHQMNDAVHKAIAATNAESVIANSDVKATLKTMGSSGGDVILDIIKDGEMGTVNLGISSSWLNSQTGGGSEQQLKKQLTDAIASLTAELDSLKDLSGSDSLVEAHRKKLVKSLVKPFKNKKGIKVKHEDFKINNNKSPAKLVKKSGTLTLAALAAGTMAKKKKLKTKKERKAKAPRMALANILGLINAKLPKQVAGNMGAPRLENQSGRFAQSVRAIDVTQTAKGFPSIGYTYAKSPYQVYESTSGSRFSDIDRDPRTLIDFSIREIVAQFGLGRLYTRRL